MNRRRFLSAASAIATTALAGCSQTNARNIRVDIISQFQDEKRLLIEISRNEGGRILFRQDLVVSASQPDDPTRIETLIDPGVPRGAQLGIEVAHNGRTESSILTIDCPQDESAGDAATIRIDTDGAVRVFSDQCYKA